jgi:hypothetical protein
MRRTRPGPCSRGVLYSGDARRCRCLGGDGLLPVPRLVLEAEGPLVYDEREWERGWHAQGSDVTYRFKLALSGHPG